MNQARSNSLVTGPAPGEMTDDFWRRRPQTAGVKVTDKLQKITVTVKADKLPTGRSRLTLFPNRFRTMSELFELLNFELKSIDGEPLGLDTAIHVLEMLNTTTNTYESFTDTTLVTNLAKLRVVGRSTVHHSTSRMKSSPKNSGIQKGGMLGVIVGGNGLRPATAQVQGSSSPLSLSYLKRPQTAAQQQHQSYPVSDDPPSPFVATSSSSAPPHLNMTNTWSATGTPPEGTFLGEYDQNVAAATSPASLGIPSPQTGSFPLPVGSSGSQGGGGGGFHLTSPSGLLLIYHAKLVTFLSSKVSVECDVNPKDLTEMEIRYEESAVKLVGQLQHMEPPRAMKVITQLALQQGKCERGFLDAEDTTRLLAELAQEKARSTRLQIDLSACQHDNGVLKGKLDSFAQSHERHRAENDAELVVHRDTANRLRQQMENLQRNYDALQTSIENANQEAQRPNDGSRDGWNLAGSLRPSTAPSPLHTRRLPPAKKQIPGSSPLQNSEDFLANTSRSLSITPTNVLSSNPQQQRARQLSALVASPLNTSSAEHGASGHRQVVVVEDGQNFYAQVQFVRLDGRTYNRRILFSINNLALSTAAGLQNFLFRELEACAMEEANENRLEAERKGGRRVSVSSIDISTQVEVRTVRNNKLVEVETNEDAKEVFELIHAAITANAVVGKGGKRVAVPPLLCLEQPHLKVDVSGSGDGRGANSSFYGTSPTQSLASAGPRSVSSPVEARNMTLQQRRDVMLQAASQANTSLPPALDKQQQQQRVANSAFRDNVAAEPAPARLVRGGSLMSMATSHHKRETPRLFGGSSMSNAVPGGGEEVMKATWAKLGGTTDTNSKGILADVLLKYLKAEFDDLGEKDRFEKVVGKVILQSDPRGITTTAGAQTALRSSYIKVDPTFLIKYEPFCVILLQVCSS